MKKPSKGLAAITAQTGETYEFTLGDKMAQVFTEQFDNR